MRLENDPYNSGDTENCWRYAKRTGTADKGYNYIVRINPYNYFIYKYGFEPSFVFGPTRKAMTFSHALLRCALQPCPCRFCFAYQPCDRRVLRCRGGLLRRCDRYIAGAHIRYTRRGAVNSSRYAVPIASCKQGRNDPFAFCLRLSSPAGYPLPRALGACSIGSRTRNTYLPPRTLGAGDFRIMFKHIFPNSLGTIITSTVLIIPGVIFSETSCHISEL